MLLDKHRESAEFLFQITHCPLRKLERYVKTRWETRGDGESGASGRRFGPTRIERRRPAAAIRHRRPDAEESVARL